MITYEVNCLVDETIVREFEPWIKPHVDAVLQFDGFISAEILQLLQDPKMQISANTKGFSIRYKLDSMNSLNHYLEHHAETMRSDGIKRFGEKLRTYRRILCEASE